jgi:adenine-specific DNA methylase
LKKKRKRKIVMLMRKMTRNGKNVVRMKVRMKIILKMSGLTFQMMMVMMIMRKISIKKRVKLAN